MHPLLKIALYVLVPLFWGVGVEYAFAKIRRYRRRSAARRKESGG